MPAPSALAIATQSVQRLVKDESYYRKELTQQTERVKKLEEDLKTKGAEAAAEDNAEFMLRQEQKAIEETRAVFAPLRQRIDDAVRRLEEQIATAESEEGSADEIANAKKALALGQSQPVDV